MKKNMILYMLVGFVGGFFSALLGVGGGVIFVPALILLLRFKMKEAVGASLAAIIPTALIGVAVHYFVESRNIFFIVALFIVVGSVIGARVGSKLTTKISNLFLKRIFALLLIFVALKLTGIIKFSTASLTTFSVYYYPFLVLLGFIAGISSALFGIGGGVIMVPVLNLFFGLEIRAAIATSLTVIVPTVFAGAIFHHKLKNINRKAVKALIPTAFIGAIIGAVTANIVSAANLKIIFGIFLLIVALRLFKK